MDNDLLKYKDGRRFKSNDWLFRSTPDFALRVQMEKNQRPIPLHSHECVEIAVICGGSGTHCSETESVAIVPGDIFVIPIGTKHTYAVKQEEHLELCNLLYSPDAIPLPRIDVFRVPEFEHIFNPVPNSPPIHFRLGKAAFQEFLPYLQALLEEESKDKPGYRMCRLGLFMVILTKLMRIHAESSGSDAFDSGIRRVLEHLNRNYLDEVDVEMLPASANMSRSKFLRLFKASSGQTPMQYVLRLRISHACRLLAEQNLSISEIAYKSGFLDSNYFTRMFRKITGMTPKFYRKMVARHAAVPEPGA